MKAGAWRVGLEAWISTAVLPLCLAASAEARPLAITREVALERELRYRPDGGDFVIVNGDRRFNRALYGVAGPGRVEAGDRPMFSLYLPGKGGTLWVGVKADEGARWCQQAERVEARYRPGEMRYRIEDALWAGDALELRVRARSDADGLLIEARAGERPMELVFAYGAANGERFSRGGDLGGDPPGAFDLKPEQCEGQRYRIDGSGFVMHSEGKRPFRMTGTFSDGAKLRVGDAEGLASPKALLESAAGGRPVLTARVNLKAGGVVRGTLVARAEGAPDPSDALEGLWARAGERARDLRTRVEFETPDPYLNTLGPALSVAADGIWDPPSYVHGAVAWPQRLNGWRGAYAADPLGWPERAREHLRYYARLQLTEPADGPVEPDPEKNLARQSRSPGTRLYSSGYIPSSDKKPRNHYDMNLVFIDMLFRHLMWTGDRDLAVEVWPVIERHLDWEKRCFDADGDGLYDAFACIWASDALQYSGGGVAYSSAYNYYHRRSAARVARWIGEDPSAHEAEAEKIVAAMNGTLWLGESGHFAEYVDFAGGVHPAAALWTFYHVIDSEVPTPAQAASMCDWADRRFAHIPVPNPDDAARPFHVLPTSDWQPYVWSVNNVAMAEVSHAALAYWQAGRPEKGFHLWKGTLLDNFYFGSSPGNFQQLSWLDAWRGELYRDFADTVGISARALVEGLLGFVPDAIAGHYRLRPGFPVGWDHARFRTPVLEYDFRREGRVDHFHIEPPQALELEAEMPLLAESARVCVNGRAVEARVERGRLRFEGPPAERHVIEIEWRGAEVAPEAVGIGSPPSPDLGPIVRDWDFKLPPGRGLEPVDLAAHFNDRVTAIFGPGKYRSPRPDSVTLQLPTQGVGDWPAFDEMHVIDDRGLRRAAGKSGRVFTPQGIPFATPGPGEADNVIFTSRWDNYPQQLEIPVSGRARRLFLLMAGSTHPMQSRFDNAELLVTYTDGSHERLALRNPETWWPIQRNYFRDDHAFRIDAPLPPRLHLASGRFEEAADFPGKEIEGGAATVLGLQLDSERELLSLELRTLAREVVVGLMAATLERP